MALKVDGVEISETAVRYELQRLVQFYAAHMSSAEIEAQMPLLRKKACQQAIGARLLIDEANALNIRVPSEEIDERLEEMIENVGGEDKFTAQLKEQGLARKQVVASIAQGLRVDKLVDTIAADVPDPTEEEMRAHFDTHRREYRLSDRVQAQHILVSPDSESEADKEVARSRLMEIRQKIVGGADFGDQAAAHSACPSGREGGGSLGWFSRGMMVPEFDEAVFSMTVGELSEIIETPFGLHIIKKTASEPGGEAEFEDVKERVMDFLHHARRGEAIATHVEELKKKAVIEED